MLLEPQHQLCPSQVAGTSRWWKVQVGATPRPRGAQAGQVASQVGVGSASTEPGSPDSRADTARRWGVQEELSEPWLGQMTQCHEDCGLWVPISPLPPAGSVTSGRSLHLSAPWFPQWSKTHLLRLVKMG